MLGFFGLGPVDETEAEKGCLLLGRQFLVARLSLICVEAKPAFGGSIPQRQFGEYRNAGAIGRACRSGD
jgi:hypothetical protein